ncbi:MAG: hypothetical protein KatS3mg034_0169 [Vicingaceae bacterium]|nr:MAG: hypothetical protein KatS3mg034_0169 [Vicingaceae bacterium]
MKKRIIVWLVFLMVLFQSRVLGQELTVNFPVPPNKYPTRENPYYWKNRLPVPGYWQQDVHYIIDAYIDEKTDIITAKERLIYTNNSPDTLRFVFFHLYQNAFQPGSYYDDLNRRNYNLPKYGPYESQGKGTEILALKVENRDVKTELDNTVLKVYLPRPLPPGDEIVFDIDFKTYFDGYGNIRRRMKTFNAWGYKHYDGVHWYPRISVYDRKFGWTTDQHLGHEFYGDFGTFDVRLNFSADFVVEATGILQNEKEVLPDSLRMKLDLKNFRKKWGGEPSVIIPYDSTKRKTWIYHAENVHDFAFTADPTYRIGEVRWNHVRVIALAQEPHAALWQNAAIFTAKVIEVYSRDFGMYAYPKMVVADARDGMEYPMLTLDGGFDPEYRGLLAHEVGHNWFFGMVGNNETYRACLDEGFTQFLTAWALTEIDGDTVKHFPEFSQYKARFREPETTVYNEAMMGYLLDASIEEDMPLNTHSDDFNGAIRHGGGYRHVYYKTATMLYNLKYVLGDSLFLKAMQHYFNQWKMCHPYVEDFRNSIIQYTKVDLNWFFDQWMETTKYIDYAITKIKKGKFPDEYIIRFKRKGTMQMPIEFTVYDFEGGKHDFYIPNTWFVKNTKAQVLPRWIGWHKNLKPYYDAKVSIPGGIKNVVIDTSKILADVNLLDNSRKLPMKVMFDHQLYNYPVWKEYRFYARPDVWYNAFDGVKAGFHVNGNYFERFHRIHLSAWFNFGSPQYDITRERNNYNPFSYIFKYETNTHKFIKNSTFELQTRWIDGLILHQAGFSFYNRGKKDKIYIYQKWMERNARYANDLYLLYPGDWTISSINSSFNLEYLHTYRYFKGKGEITLALRTPSLFAENDFSRIQLTAINYNNIGKIELRTRFFAQVGTGTPPLESSLYLAGANPEEMMENKFFRSRMITPVDFTQYGSTTGHFQAGGGLNLRGYNNYVAPENKGDTIVLTYRGKSGASFSTELEFDKLIPLKFKKLSGWMDIDMYLFYDAGFINDQWKFDNNFLPRMDAGPGMTLTIKKWWQFEKPSPLTIRADFPLFLNRPPAGEDYFAFRWLISINKSF